MFSVPCTEVGAQNVGADSIGIESAANIGDILKSIAAIVKKLGLFNEKEPSQTYEQWVQAKNIPEYSGLDYVEINGNIPFFTDAEKNTKEVFENYSELDSLGRCGAAYANVCAELMPTGKRESISSVKPSGWHSISLNGKKGSSLYNRSHLIAHMLAGENANPKNLITGTEHFNQETMQTFEIKVKDYLDSTNNHVLYRVTPVFKGNELIARGVLMEAWSVEDKGKGVCFNVFCYNIQSGVVIDYATGNATVGEAAADKAAADNTSDHAYPSAPENATYVLNKNSKKFHLPSCDSVFEMKEKNREYVTWTREECIAEGYSPCGSCKP